MTIPDHVLIALAERSEREVLALTVHVQRNPLRVSFLDAENNLLTFQSEAPKVQMLGVSGVNETGFGSV